MRVSIFCTPLTANTVDETHGSSFMVALGVREMNSGSLAPATRWRGKILRWIGPDRLRILICAAPP